MARTALFAFFTLLCSLYTSLQAQAQSAGDCGASVSLNGTQLEISSEEGRDTENLQCALDTAVEEGITSIRLVSSEYAIDRVSVNGFVGELTGKSQDTTSLNLREGAVDCSAADASAMAFYRGPVKIKNMTINVGELCGGTGQSATAVAFYSDTEKCDKPTTFGNVDRVIIQGPGAAALDILTGVRMTNTDTCESKVRGDLTVNRVIMDGLAFGVVSSVDNAGQVNITFNTFTNMGTSVAIANAKQLTAIDRNTITYNDNVDYVGFEEFGETGIFIAGDTNAPSPNLTTIKSNTFINAGVGAEGFAVLVGQEDKEITHTMWVSNNRFEGVASSSGTARTPAWNNTVQTAAAPAQAIEYTQDWEGDEAEALTGWLGFINVFGADCSSYLFGYPYSALGSAVAVIADGADSKVLNVYNDYDGTAWGEGDVNCLQANVYRQVTIETENAGDYEFSYTVDPPELAGDNTIGFVRIFSLPSYALENEFTQVSAPGEQTISFTLEESMAGKALQFGFSTTSLRSENSGMQYDNLVFGAAGASGGGGNGGGEPSGSGSGYGVAVLDTDGVIVSGNRFVKGASAWVLSDASTLNSVSNWSVVDNTFTGAQAKIDYALGSSTQNFVVGPGQGNPDVVDNGDNYLLDGSDRSGDTDGNVDVASQQISVIWSILTGS